MAKVQSIEPNIVGLFNGQLKDCGLDYKLEQESLIYEIDKALNEYAYKSGGSGKNRLTSHSKGKFFNEVYSRLGNSQDKLNDIVLNPSYEAKLLVKLTGINKN